MSKYWIFVKLFFLALLVFIIQSSFFNSFLSIFNRIDLFLFLIIWLFIFYNFKTSLYFALFSGLILDIFSFYPFGIYTLVFLSTVILADFVWNNFFTNRSIYSFLSLSFFLVLFHSLFLYLLLFLSEKAVFGVYWFNKIFWLNMFLSLLWVSFGVVVSFYFLRQPKSRSSSLSFEKN